jgi:hypothetical protein
MEEKKGQDNPIDGLKRADNAGRLSPDEAHPFNEERMGESCANNPQDNQKKQIFGRQGIVVDKKERPKKQGGKEILEKGDGQAGMLLG